MFEEDVGLWSYEKISEITSRVLFNCRSTAALLNEPKIDGSNITGFSVLGCKTSRLIGDNHLLFNE